jgi:YD repeat-containing protein
VYTYDPNNGKVKTVSRAKHEGTFDKTSEPDGWVITEYEYDLRGNRTKIVEDVGGMELTTTYEYNYQDEVTKVTLPTGKWTKTYRDGRGTKVKTEVGYDSTVVATTEFEYDGNGNLKKKTAPNGIVTEYDYDDFDRLEKVTRGL